MTCRRDDSVALTSPPTTCKMQFIERSRADCNLKKKDMPFVEWLTTLTPNHQELARTVYADKHDGMSPEDFVPEDREDIVIEIGVNLEDLDT